MDEITILAPNEPPRRGRAFAVLGAAVLVTIALLSLALYLGAWAFEYRSATLHERRLDKLVEAKASRGQVIEGLKIEGLERVATARTELERHELATRWGATKRDHVIADSAPWPILDLFVSPNVVYFLYFDANGRIRGFDFVVR